MSLESWHAVIGLGTDGGQALADGDELARGVHLAWTLRPDLGFPAGGYAVFRRAHRRPEWGCMDPENGLFPPHGATEWRWLDHRFEIKGEGVRLEAGVCPPTGAVHVLGEGSLTITTSRRSTAVRAVGVGDPPVVEVLADAGDGPRVVAGAPAAAGAEGWLAEVWAEGIVGCRLTGDDMRVCGVCFGEAEKTGGWDRLHDEPILTPVVGPGTANDAANLHGPEATRSVARARLSATLGSDARRELAAAFAGVGELVEDALRDGREAMVPVEAAEATGARTPPRLALATLQAVALAAVDPDVARMLGLSWHDPVDSGRWDYKVVAHHGAVRFPGRTVTFDALAAGAVGAPTVAVDGVTFAGNLGLEVVAAPARSGRTQALRIAAPLIGTAAGLRLDRPAPALTLRLEGAAVVPFAGWLGAQQVTSAVAVRRDRDPRGRGRHRRRHLVRGHLRPPRRGAPRPRGARGGSDRLRVEALADPPAPVQGLALTDAGAAVEPTRLRADGTVDTATAVVGLDWSASSPTHDAGRPVRAHVGRATAGSAPEVRNAQRPAAAFARSPGGGRAAPGPDVPRRWIEHGLAPGSYAWSVRGIDVFGRLGPWSEETVVAVPAGVVPPPPDAVAASYLDAADPSLSDEERAMAERDGPGLLVSWTWPAGRRLAAPGVEPRGEFRVYARRGDPNVLEGTVLDVTDRGDRSRLRTDCAVPGGADDLAGQHLRVGGASFPVVGNAAGRDAAIEVAHLTAPTARPTTGTFTVDLTATSALSTNLAVPRGFGELVHTEAVGALPRVTARVVAVAARGDSATVRLADALPATEAELLPGLLVSRGIAYAVLEQTPGSASVRCGPPCSRMARRRSPRWATTPRCGPARASGPGFRDRARARAPTSAWG